jgi:lipoprotein-anchoring transpeptidase ErfK/SrfK
VFAFGISATSPALTDWPGGGIIGIHGTNQPELIPGRISHGCVRVPNRKINRLRKLMSLGTPIEIR